MPPMPPQELSDMIIDYLHNDETALRSAGLVCKSWFPASRFHLFSDIKLSVYNAYNNGLAEAICAEGSTIPPYVLHLEIENKGQDAKNVDTVLLRLPLFSNLKTLSLGQIKWANLTPSAEKCVTTMARNITTLSLYYFTFGTVDEAIAFIASAPCLENLIFWSVQCDDNAVYNYSSQAKAPPLKRIRIDMNPLTDAIINWFCRCYSTPNVHTLVVDEFTGFYIPTMCNFIRHLGSALENFTISCPFFESDFALSKQLDLSQNISLRNISFDSVILFADSLRPRSWAWMISIISRIPHHSLERVTVTIFLRYAEQINALELSALDTLFLSQSLSYNSTKVCFDICGDVDMDAARRLLKNTLPGLVGKGRLEL